jgi:hypothetical protein
MKLAAMMQVTLMIEMMVLIGYLCEYGFAYGLISRTYNLPKCRWSES